MTDSMKRPVIVGLLFVYMVINFADKAVLGFVAVPMMKEMELTPEQFGMVASSFFALFSISGLVTGFLANRFRTKWIIAALALIWACTQFPMVFWPSLTTLLICRILLGAGEGPAYPVAIHAVYKWYRNDERTLPTGIISQGAPVGVIISAPILGYVIAQYGWRAAFMVLGVLGLVWVVLWLALGAEGPETETAKKEVSEAGGGPTIERASYVDLLTDRSIIGTVVSTFAAYWILAVGLTWLPPYLQKGLGYDVINTGWLISVIVGANIPVQLAGSWLSERWFKRGVSSRVSRGLIVAGANLAAGASIFVAILGDFGLTAKIVFLAIGCALPNLAFCIGPAIIGEVTPASQRGAILGVNIAVSTLAGLLAPSVTGWLLGSASTPLIGYNNGYELAATILMIAGVLGAILMHPEASRARLENRNAPQWRAQLQQQ